MYNPLFTIPPTPTTHWSQWGEEKFDFTVDYHFWEHPAASPLARDTRGDYELLEEPISYFVERIFSYTVAGIILEHEESHPNELVEYARKAYISNNDYSDKNFPSYYDFLISLVNHEYRITDYLNDEEIKTTMIRLMGTKCEEGIEENTIEYFFNSLIKHNQFEWYELALIIDSGSTIPLYLHDALIYHYFLDIDRIYVNEDAEKVLVQGSLLWDNKKDVLSDMDKIKSCIRKYFTA